MNNSTIAARLRALADEIDPPVPWKEFPEDIYEPPPVPPVVTPPATNTIGSLIGNALVPFELVETKYMTAPFVSGYLTMQMRDVLSVLAKWLGIKLHLIQACPAVGQIFYNNPAHVNPPAWMGDFEYFEIDILRKLLKKFKEIYPKAICFTNEEKRVALGLNWVRTAPYHDDHFHLESGDVIELGVKLEEEI